MSIITWKPCFIRRYDKGPTKEESSVEHVYLWRILLSMFGGAAEYSAVCVYVEHEHCMLNGWHAVKFQLV
jgi:hypothetical protein